MIAPAIFSELVNASSSNLIANPLVETADPSNSNSPADWQVGTWGTNTFTSSYLNSGPVGDTNSVKINMTAYSSGDAKWYFTPVSVTSGTQYTFSDEYESNVTTDIQAEFTNSSGVASYEDLGDQSASPSWNKALDTFSVPTGTVSVSIFHLINSVGSLTTSDFSLIASSTPSVSITAPSANGDVSGKSVELAANASDNDGIANVQFKVNGSNVGGPVTSAPYEYNWDSTTVANGTYNITAVATNIDGASTTSAPVAVNVDNVAPLGTNLIANPLLKTPSPTNASSPADWQIGNWGTNKFTSSYLNSGPASDPYSVELKMTSYTSGDAKWYFNPVSVSAGTEYTFSDYYQSTTSSSVVIAYTMSDGSSEYVTIGTLAASSSWQTFSASFVAPTGALTATVYHLIESVGTLSTSNFSFASSTAPTVTITAPTASTATSTPYSGTIILEASATDNSGISGIQFEVDGKDVGSPVTTAPYEYSWNTASVTNGAHIITAIATNVNNETTTSIPVDIEVSNTVAAGGNLIPNPLMSTPSNTSPGTPQDWVVDSWGTNKFTSSYLKSGSTGDPYSAQIKMTSYTSGDAKWVFTPQNVALDTQYEFSDYYESNVQTQVDAVFTMSDGTTDYEIIGYPYVASTWTEFSSKFSVPYGAQTVTIYHLIQSVGTLTIDNTSLTTYVPVGFNSALLTLTFDDGYETSYTNALPLLKQYGMTSTQFVITDLIGKSGYMTATQLKSYYTDGDEIASHTVTHDDLTQESASQLTTEMTGSKSTLEKDTGETVTDLAYPYGLYNTNVINAAKTYYSSARGVESGLNSKDNFNAYDLKVEDIYTTTTTAQVADWVAQAQITKTWLILVYHGVDANTANPVDGDIYDISPTELSAQLAAIKASGVNVETLNKALPTVEAQM